MSSGDQLQTSASPGRSSDIVDRISRQSNPGSVSGTRAQPLVSVTIPTFNSAKTLALCLDSVMQQTYKNIEIIVINGDSTDNTETIARKYDVNIVNYSGALLGARNEGTQLSCGKYVLLLDSDQVLRIDAIQRAVSVCEASDKSMIVLEESVYKNEKIIEKLFEYDRQLIKDVRDFSPYTGVMLPRFYRADLLRSAFAHIQEKYLREVGGQDHAIIYFEAWQIDQSVDIIEEAVKHIEPDSLILMWNKFYRWGRTSRRARLGDYSELLQSKERFRSGSFRRANIKTSLASLVLLLIKGVPYKLGVLVSRVERAKN